MAYVYYEEVPEGMEEADVVDRVAYDGVVMQRDEAIGRAENAESAYSDLRTKYANAFLTTPQRIKRDNERDVKSESRPQSFKSLFGMRDKGAY